MFLNTVDAFIDGHQIIKKQMMIRKARLKSVVRLIQGGGGMKREEEKQ